MHVEDKGRYTDGRIDSARDCFAFYQWIHVSTEREEEEREKGPLCA